MESFLKTAEVKIERLGRTLRIQELSGRAQSEVSKALAGGDPALAAAMVCKYGVVEWAAESVEDILANVGVMTAEEIGRAVYALCGLDLAKNSEPAPSADSSSVSGLRRAS